jgi:hypothetical protein
LAKYLVNEASLEERLIVEKLLRENEGIRNDFQKLMGVYYFNEVPDQVDTYPFFDKLNSRIEKK